MIRVRSINEAPVKERAQFVLYWMIASRRTRWNFALQRAVGWARDLGKPLVILEALRKDYPWASDRINEFIIGGMRANARALEKTPAVYYPYLEPRSGAGKGLLEALSSRAAVVVTDDYPCFFLPRAVQAAGRKIPVLLEAVDSNGLLPLAATDRVFKTAHSFRRFLQKELPDHLDAFPKANPLARVRIPSIEKPLHTYRRWPPADVPEGPDPATNTLRKFVREGLPRYREVTSGLSPYLHFGHISSHQVFSEVMAHEGWGPDDVSPVATGSRQGWWNVGESAEAFLDQLVTWREIGFNMAAKVEGYDRYDSLPDWAKETLADHEGDPREHVYTLRQLDRSATHDTLWNAAQAQLVREGRIHNYLRMLWGKKILEWSRSPREALRILIELNNRYALDGRDPNSYSGIFWILGRYDRPWGPERPIFGKVRYMSSANTARKMNVRPYLEEYGC